MDFLPYRNLLRAPDLSILEGLFTLKNAALPNILLAITTIIFQGPHASPMFIFTSLPVLIHLAESQTAPAMLLNTLPTLLFSTLASVGWTVRGLLPQASEQLLGGSAMATLISSTSLAAVALHRQAVRRRLFAEGSWETVMLFGLLWAGAWAMFSFVSPFGRFGVPSPFPSDLEIVARLSRYTGLVGTDFLMGSAAYAAYSTGVDLHHKVHRLTGRANADPCDTGAVREETIRHSQSRISSRTSVVQPSIGVARDPQALPLHEHRRVSKPALALAGVAAVLTAWPEATIESVSEPLSTQTPFGLGFVLPSGKSKWTLADLVHEAQTIGNRADLLVFPESAFLAYDQWDRQWAIDTFVREVCRRYGVWVQLGIDSPFDPDQSISGSELESQQLRHSKKINEVVLIGPNGVVGSYAKQKLIPFIESFPFHRGIMPVPTWQIQLPPPPGTNKTDWTPDIPHTRPVRLSPLICLDTFHPDLLSRLDPAPDLFTVSAAALTVHIAKRIIGQAESIALIRSVPVMIVASSRGRIGQGINAVLDGWGRVIHQQRGGRSFVVQVALPNPGSSRQRTAIGTRGVLGARIAILAIAAAARVRKQQTRNNSYRMRILRYFGAETTQTEISPLVPTPSAGGSLEAGRRSTQIRSAWNLPEGRLINVDEECV